MACPSGTLRRRAASQLERQTNFQSYAPDKIISIDDDRSDLVATSNDQRLHSTKKIQMKVEKCFHQKKFSQFWHFSVCFERVWNAAKTLGKIWFQKRSHSIATTVKVSWSIEVRYVRRVMFWRSWVQIPAPSYSGWTFFTFFVPKNYSYCLKKTKKKPVMTHLKKLYIPS